MRYLCLVVVLVACGGGGEDPPLGKDAAIDASDVARCLITPNYGDLGAKTGTTSQGPTSLTIVLDPGPPRDSFFIKLNTGQGVFAGGLMTGTFTLAGADLNFSACGLCVNIIADIVTGQGPSKFYFATAGSVTLTSHTPPIGSLSNVMFQEITSGGQPVAGGCNASITTMSFGT